MADYASLIRARLGHVLIGAGGRALARHSARSRHRVPHSRVASFHDLLQSSTTFARAHGAVARISLARPSFRRSTRGRRRVAAENSQGAVTIWSLEGALASFCSLLHSHSASVLLAFRGGLHVRDGAVARRN